MEYFKNKNDFEPIYIVPIHENIIQSDDSISHYIMHDYLHLTDTGYTKIWTAVYEKLKAVINNQ